MVPWAHPLCRRFHTAVSHCLDGLGLHHFIGTTQLSGPQPPPQFESRRFNDSVHHTLRFSTPRGQTHATVKNRRPLDFAMGANMITDRRFYFDLQFGKITGILQKTPNCGKMAIMIFLFELILVFCCTQHRLWIEGGVDYAATCCHALCCLVL